MFRDGMLPDDFAKLESATQYPSIPTLHEIGDKGRLTEELRVAFSDAEKVEVTEKIDGTNARIILSPDTEDAPLIGSRTALLTYLTDVIHNPAEGIVDTVRGIARKVWTQDPAFRAPDHFLVLFGEVYGGKVGPNAKNYTASKGVTGFRLFDVALVPVDILRQERAQIAAWREHGGQKFWSRAGLEDLADQVGAETVPLLGPLAGPPHATLAGVREWLGAVMPRSLVTLEDSGQGRPEGVVIRTPDRSRIAKIRYQDYDRTLRT